VDTTLQLIVKDQALYFKNLAESNSDLKNLTLPPNVSIFMYDAVAMYPSIYTTNCLDCLSGYLSNKEVSQVYEFLSEALLEALELVMLNNRMRFGDIIVKQISGIVMGMSPAPTIANLYMVVSEEAHVLKYIPSVVLYLHCFIDDGLGVWLHDPNPAFDERNWTEFQTCLNAYGLWWIFSKCCREVVFMDLWLKIKGRKIVTSLFAKPMVLHLYLPPHSCHAPGVLSGLVFENILCIHQLCSDAWDVVKEIKLFLHCLLDQGYQLVKLTFLFQKAMDNAKAYLRCTALDHLCAKSSKEASHCQQVFLHQPYHPANPLSKPIQKLWAN
jgi:hypothetical protein